jgi:hypothetical protein
MNHLTPEQLEAFVTGAALTDEAALRAHVHACPACAKALAREARLETALHLSGHAIALAGPSEAPRDAAPVRHHAPGFGLWRTALAAAAVLVVVAGIAWMLRGRAPQATPGAESAPVAGVPPQPSAAPTPTPAPVVTPTPTPTPTPTLVATPTRSFTRAPRVARQAPAQPAAPFVMPDSLEGMLGYDTQSPRTFGLHVFAPDTSSLFD